MTPDVQSKKTGRWLLFLAVLSLSAALAGCAGDKRLKEDHFFDEWKARAETAKAYTPSPRTRDLDLPAAPEAASPPPVVSLEPARSLPTVKVSMTMRNTDVNVIIRALARTANQNIMLSSEVEGNVNINVQDTPWDQVFLGLLRTKGLTHVWEGDIIRIMTVADMEHDLQIEAMQEKRESQKLGLKRVEPLLTRIMPIDYADPAKLRDNLQEFLTRDAEGKPRGFVTVDDHNRALIVQAIADDLARIIPLVEKLDKPTAQIQIEANIVEATRETARELGVQWGGMYRGTSGGNNYWITPGANAGNIMGQPLIQTDPATGAVIGDGGINPTTGLGANFPADLADGTGLTLGFVKESIGRYLLNVQLSALEKESKLNILSSPTITTIDNQVAVVESGSEVPYQTVDRNQQINIEFKKAVLKLEVTPHVIDQKLLKLNILIHKDELDFTRTVEGNPTIITKKAETSIILRDGQTTVLGGLTKETIANGKSGVPGLKDVPLFGVLFKGTGTNNQMEEVLIFLTPHILNEEAQDN